jgi:hypothetical protein
MLKEWLKLLPSKIGLKLQKHEEGFTIRWSPEELLIGLKMRFAEQLERWVSIIGFVFAGILLAFLLINQLNAAFTNPYFTPVGVIEETAYVYTSANNFIDYGYWRTGFLQDMASSSNPADHPYIYNHMPPGSDIFLSLLLWVSGRNYAFTRVVYALIFISGVVVYLSFVTLIFKPLRLTGVGFTILFVGAWALVLGMDRHVSNPFLLLGFSPFIVLYLYYQTKRRLYFYLYLFIALISSFYLEVHVVVGLVSAWFFLYITQLIRVDFKHMVLYIGTVTFGVVLHLLQNLLYLGPGLFIQEFSLLLSNRILGYPSPEEMKDFYDSVGIVHHGARALNSEAFISQILGNLTFPGYQYILLTLFLSLLVAGYILYHHNTQSFEWFISKDVTVGISYFARLTLWIAGSVLAPLFLFPAFAQEFNLRHSSRAHFYFLIIGIVAVLAYGFRQIIRQLPWSNPRNNALPSPTIQSKSIEFNEQKKSGVEKDETDQLQLPQVTVFVRFALWIGLIASLIISINQLSTASLQELENVYSVYRSNWNASLDELNRFSGNLYMTNINVPVVGFLTRSPGYGVCDQDSISAQGTLNLNDCKVAFNRRNNLYATQRPKYFFFFTRPEFFPGFADCLPDTQLSEGGECVPFMRRRLASNFDRVFKNETFEVYDLHNEVNLHPIKVEIVAPNTVDIQTKVGRRIDNQLTLLGYDLFFDLNNAEEQGDFLISLYWENLIDSQDDETLIVTMRDNSTDQIFNSWQVSLGKTDASNLWQAGQIINTVYRLDVKGLMDGRYNLEIGLISQNQSHSGSVELDADDVETILEIDNVQEKVVVRLKD